MNQSSEAHTKLPRLAILPANGSGSASASVVRPVMTLYSYNDVESTKLVMKVLEEVKTPASHRIVLHEYRSILTVEV